MSSSDAITLTDSTIPQVSADNTAVEAAEPTVAPEVESTAPEPTQALTEHQEAIGGIAAPVLTSTGSLPKVKPSQKRKHTLNAVGSAEAMELDAKRKAFEEQKQRDIAKYLADQQEDAERESGLKAAQAEKDALTAAQKKAEAANADIEATNNSRRKQRNRLWVIAGAMAVLAIAAFITSNVFMGGW
ncbi:hypothetical protein [Citricoccus nitrophenolicus]|uniref:hypothetical protein n=1 Tax=Citricoccus nitrophenolicus TaxID=863575 RepID=UPI0031E9228C